MRYQDLGADYYERRAASIRRQIAHHVGKLGASASKSPSAASPHPNPADQRDSQVA